MTSAFRSLYEAGDRGCIRNAVHHAKTDKLLEGEPVVDLKFMLFIVRLNNC